VIETKVAPARILEAKAEGTKGEATALVSVFGNVDLGGDRMMPGAFSKTLEAWRTKGDPIPVIWSHDWDNPESFVGSADPKSIEETEDGLVVAMKFDLERPRAEQVFHLLKERRVTQFSFGYFASDFETVDDPDYGQVRELREVELFEVGPTLLGMNPATQLLEAASALTGSKAGRVLSSKNESHIRAAYEALGNVLASIADQEKAAALEAKSAELEEDQDKASPDEAVEGAFVSWASEDETYIGRIEHVMTEGILGVPGSEFQLEGSPDDPAILVRLFEDSDAGYVETELFAGARASQVDVVPDPRAAEEELEEELEEDTASKTTDAPEQISGDRASTIDHERLMELLTRPRHTEE
jgi:HK97 family phage prohead protease